MNLSNRSKGIIYIILSAFGFAMMSAFVKHAGDLTSFHKAFFRNIIAAFVAFILVIKNKDSFVGKKENQKLLIPRTFFGTLGIIFNYYAIDNLVLSDANMLNKLSPFFVIVFSALFLKEKIKPQQIIAMIVAFIGMLFVVRPQFSLDVIPSLIGVLGGISAAAAYTCVRALGGKEKANTIVFYFSFFSSVILLPFMMINYKPMSMLQFVYLIVAGIFASMGQFGITLAYRFAPAKEISIFDYTNILFAAVISYVVFGTIPMYLSFIGYAVIFSASLYMFMYNKKLDKAEGK